MKKICLILLLFVFTNTALAGDTTTIRIHDHTDMTWYGNYDEWGVLPDATLDYRKIYLHYTMGCPSSGCAPYDYTTKVEVLHRTGEIDSILQNSPNFTVNGNILDTVYFSYNPLYIYSWDSISNSLDSIASDALEIIQFNDASNPTIATDTLLAYESNINVFYFDSLGNITDTIFFTADSSWILNYYNWYTSYDVIEKYELARVITPYGGNISNSYAFTHTFDITDFIQILRDSVEIRCHYSGWGSGWSATLDFEFIEGTPVRDVVKIENIYSGSYNYSSSNDFETNTLVPKKFLIEPNSSQAMVKMTTTGHGFDNNIAAAEFYPINYYVKINGGLTHTQYNWNSNCGENPIYPFYETSSSYVHTWLLDRANWCPGLKATPFDHEITSSITPGDSVEINIDFQSYSWSGDQTPSYIIECQLFQYGDANFTTSAEIIDIIKPSLKDEHNRKNPICGKPLIKIRNYGSTTLTSLNIEYKVIGGSAHTFNWTGNLNFLETEEVELPNLSNWAGSENTFEVTLSNPNGQPDDYSSNNTMKSEFSNVPEYPGAFVLWVGTNSGVINSSTQESETSWDFYDEAGDAIYTSGSLYANIQYRDTLTFSAGCYAFVVEDTDEDGLDYYYNDDGGGMVRFREIGPSWLKSFNANFGTNIIHQFTVGSWQQTTSTNQNAKWEIYPNPTRNNITIEGYSDYETKVSIMNNLGKTVINIKRYPPGFVSEALNLSDLENGIYFLEISNSETKIIKKIVKQ